MTLGAPPRFAPIFASIGNHLDYRRPSSPNTPAALNYPGVAKANEKVIRNARALTDQHNLFHGEELLIQDKRLGATPGKLKDFFNYNNKLSSFYFSSANILDRWLQWRFPKWSEGRRAKLIGEVMPPAKSPGMPNLHSSSGYSLPLTYPQEQPFSPVSLTTTQIRVSALGKELKGKSFESLIALFTDWLDIKNVEKIADAIQWAVGTENKPVAKALVAFMATNPNVPDALLAAKLPTNLYSVAHIWPKMAFGILIHRLLQNRIHGGDGYLNSHSNRTSIDIITKLEILAVEVTILDGKYYHDRVDVPR